MTSTIPNDVATEFLPGLDDATFTRARAMNEPALLKTKREEAFALYRRTPSPTARDEEWRRTDPSLFGFEAFSPLPQLNPGPAMAAEAIDEQFDVVVTVTDTHFAILRRTESPVVVLSLADAALQCGDLLRTHLQGSASPKTARKHTALVDAFWNFGLFIHAPAGTQIPRGVLVRYEHAAAGKMILPRILLVAEAGSVLTVAEHYRSADGIAFLAVGSREMYVGDNAVLKIVSLQEWGNETACIGEDWSQVGRDGKIDWVTLSLGAKVGKQMCGCDVRAPNANAFLSGLYFATGKQHFDQRTLQQHSSHHTYSNLLYKGAVKDEAHSVYQGIIAAGRGAIKVDAYQMNKNLVLSPNARADSLPGLEIDADDLKCSHGSTIGTLDPDQLFYLMSRGLSRSEARQMLVNAFFEEVIERVPYEFMQERIRHHVAEKMG